MQKLCAQCGIRFECSASTDCWCTSVAAWQGIQASAQVKHSGSLCKTCLWLSFYHPATLKSAWENRLVRMRVMF
jgi:hypothetical protein